MRILFTSLAILAVIACTPTAGDLERRADAEAGARAALDKELAGLVPGRPQNCVSQLQLRSGPKAYGSTLVYTNSSAEKYVNRTSGGCERIGTGGDAILVTRTPSTQLCSGDIATTVDQVSRFQNGSCSFGEFIPYTRASGS
jgi:hypothetical protein